LFALRLLTLFVCLFLVCLHTLPGQQPDPHDRCRRDQRLGRRGWWSGCHRRRGRRRTLDLADSDILVTRISQAAPVVELGGGIVAGHRAPNLRVGIDALNVGVQTSAGLVRALDAKLPAIENQRIHTVRDAVVGCVDVEAVVSVPRTRFHVVLVAKEYEIVPALVGPVSTGTAYDIMELVAVVIDLGVGFDVVDVVVSADPRAIFGGGSRINSQILAERIVRAEGLFDALAEAFEQSPDVPRPVGVHCAFQIIATGDAGVGKIKAFPQALTGGGRFSGSHLQQRRARI